ncbi:MAG: hypothetical protein JO069_18730, partial [Verrucomicrobia bacterium]|nr:hypothetical protein [Verrucomicrobiota bacterium]
MPRLFLLFICTWLIAPALPGYQPAPAAAAPAASPIPFQRAVRYLDANGTAYVFLDLTRTVGQILNGLT